MNRIKKIALNLVASSVLLANLSICATPSKAQTEPVADQPDETVLVLAESAGPDGSDFGGPEGNQPSPEKLGLSDEQMEKLVALKSEYEVKTAPQKAELCADMKKMGLMMSSPRLDKDAIMSLHEKIDSIKTELCTARVKHMLSAMDVMTDKQREEMHHHMLVRMLSHHHMKGGMKHHGPPDHQG